MGKKEQEFPLISIIVPIYNTGIYLEKCIQSIVNQSYSNLEIILVDDGSTDNSGRICDFWAKLDGRIQVIHKKNEGLVSARKTGIVASKGSYIAHLDSDDWVESEMYENMLQLALTNEAEVVTSGIVRNYENHMVIEMESVQPGVYKGANLESVFWPNIISMDSFFKTNVNIHITNKLIKRELALKHQMKIPDDVKIGEDAAVIYPVLFDAKCIVVSGKVFYHYVMHPESMMNEKNKRENGCGKIEKIFYQIIEEKKAKIPTIEKQLSRVLFYLRLFEDVERVFQIQGNRLYPFENLFKDEKVIIYGAGRFGCRVYEYLKKTPFCEVVILCDKVIKKQVVSIEDALQYDFDKVLIAVLISDIADEIEQSLVNKGIQKNKISRMGTE